MFASAFVFNKSSIDLKFISMEIEFDTFLCFSLSNTRKLTHTNTLSLFLCACGRMVVCLSVYWRLICNLVYLICRTFFVLFCTQIWTHQTSDLILLRIFFNGVVVVAVRSTLMNHHVVVERAPALQPTVTAGSCRIASCICRRHLLLIAERPDATCKRLTRQTI